MPAIFRDVPFYKDATTVQVGGDTVQIFPWQIVVWVSLTHRAIREPEPRAHRFLAVFDTGFTDGFLIHKQQLLHYAGYQPHHVPSTPHRMHPHGRVIPIHAANVWLHPNLSGQRAMAPGAEPFLLDLPRGIGVCDDPDGYPRLPLLGQAAFHEAGLQVAIDYQRLRFSVRTPRRFWFFG
jgi:hypothetical protein